MSWEMIFELIDPKYLVVVAACWVLGFILKQTPKVPDWLIVYIIVLIAIVFALWIDGFGPQALIQGILAGAFAVFGNQVIKQAKEGFSKSK